MTTTESTVVFRRFTYNIDDREILAAAARIWAKCEYPTSINVGAALNAGSSSIKHRIQKLKQQRKWPYDGLDIKQFPWIREYRGGTQITDDELKLRIAASREQSTEEDDHWRPASVSGVADWLADWRNGDISASYVNEGVVLTVGGTLE